MRREPEKALRRPLIELLELRGFECYDLDTGALAVPDGRGGVVVRRGGTRVDRPGFADLIVYGWEIPFTIETKSPSGSVRPDQWAFAEARALAGDPHLIVRSVGATVRGLEWLGILRPGELQLSADDGLWPDNINYLEATAAGLERRGFAFHSRPPLPRNRKRRPSWEEAEGADRG